jgi:hypothetical protein
VGLWGKSSEGVVRLPGGPDELTEAFAVIDVDIELIVDIILAFSVAKLFFELFESLEANYDLIAF